MFDKFFKNTKMQFATAFGVSIVLVAGTAVVSNVAKPNYSVVLSLAHTQSSGSVADLTSHKLKELMENYSGNRMGITIYPNSGIANGDINRTAQMVATGGIDVEVSSAAHLASVDQRFEAFWLPFLFENEEQLKFFANSKEAKETLNKWLESKNVKLLALSYGGHRHISNNVREITKPEDLQGLKLRVAPFDILSDIYKNYGAEVVQKNFAEVPLALKNGEIQGQENPLSVFLSARLYDTQKYITLWNGVSDIMLITCNLDSYKKLTKEQQDILEKSATEASLWRNNLEQEFSGLYEKALVSKGVKITRLSPAQVEAFQKASVPVYERYVEKIGIEPVLFILNNRGVEQIKVEQPSANFDDLRSNATDLVEKVQTPRPEQEVTPVAPVESENTTETVPTTEVTEAAPATETVAPAETQEVAPATEPVAPTETQEVAPATETVAPAETQEVAATTEPVAPAETQEVAPATETVAPAETQEVAPTTETVAPAEAQEVAPATETVAPTETQEVAPATETVAPAETQEVAATTEPVAPAETQEVAPTTETVAPAEAQEVEATTEPVAPAETQEVAPATETVAPAETQEVVPVEVEETTEAATTTEVTETASATETAPTPATDAPVVADSQETQEVAPTSPVASAQKTIIVKEELKAVTLPAIVPNDLKTQDPNATVPVEVKEPAPVEQAKAQEQVSEQTTDKQVVEAKTETANDGKTVTPTPKSLQEDTPSVDGFKPVIEDRPSVTGFKPVIEDRPSVTGFKPVVEDSANVPGFDPLVVQTPRHIVYQQPIVNHGTPTPKNVAPQNPALQQCYPAPQYQAPQVQYVPVQSQPQIQYIEVAPGQYQAVQVVPVQQVQYIPVYPVYGKVQGFDSNVPVTTAEQIKASNFPAQVAPVTPKINPQKPAPHAKPVTPQVKEQAPAQK